jgi:plastocyanin
MRVALRTGRAVGALGLAGLLLGSCGGNGGEVTDPPITGTEIRATVTLDGSGEAGVTVRLYQPGAGSPMTTATTNANGTAVFGGLSAGAYEVEVVVPAGAELEEGAARRPVSVASGQSAGVTFSLTTPTTPPTGRVDIVLTSTLRFSPSQVTIQAGTTVRWINDVTMFHTITPDGHSEWAEGTVTSAGDTFEHTFNNAGTFAYFCSPHRGDAMTGVIIVQ